MLDGFTETCLHQQLEASLVRVVQQAPAARVGFNSVVVLRLLSVTEENCLGTGSSFTPMNGPFALYETASRFNHSCVGNAAWLTMNSNIIVFAVCDVEVEMHFT